MEINIKIKAHYDKWCAECKEFGIKIEPQSNVSEVLTKMTEQIKAIEIKCFEEIIQMLQNENKEKV